MRHFAAAILTLCLILPFSAQSGEKNDDSGVSAMLVGFDAGLGGTYFTSEYKGMEENGTSIPLIGYEGEHVYLRGLSAGVHLVRLSFLEINAQVSYLPQHFYADRSSRWVMRRLDDRYSTMLAGLNTRVFLPVGIFSATASMDVLGYSQGGVILDGNYTLPIRLGSLSIAPTIGVQWTDSQYNKYYYGIDHGEARASGLKHYDPESCFSPYAQISAKLNFTENWSAFASVRTLFLGQEITDSPMVENHEVYSFSLGAMYKF